MKNRITIAQLLNKIANGEEVPKQVKWLDYIWTFDTMVKDYVGNGAFLFQDNIMNFESVYDFLNLELEIVEDKPKVLSKLSYQQIGSWNLEQHNYIEYARAVDTQIQQLGSKLNKVIDKVNKLEKEVINDND